MYKEIIKVVCQSLGEVRWVHGKLLLLLLHCRHVLQSWNYSDNWAIPWQKGPSCCAFSGPLNEHSQLSSGARSPALWLKLSPSRVQTMKPLARLCRYAGWPEPSLFAHVISILFSWACSIVSVSFRKYLRIEFDFQCSSYDKASGQT